MKALLNKYFFLLPIIYLFMVIFIARSKVQYVYLAAGLIVAITAFTQYKQLHKPIIRLAQWMAVLSAIGVSAAFILSIEKIELLADPNYVASCSLSPVVACSPIIASPQASAFGFPNSFIGIFGFTAVFVAAITIAAGAVKLSRAWWRTLLAGIFGGTVFSSWLIYQGVFEIGKLCLYCMLVWLVTFALLWLVCAYTIENKLVNFGRRANKLLSYRYELILISYCAIFLIIFYKWSDYWLSLI